MSYVLLRRLIVNNERGPLICTLASVIVIWSCAWRLVHRHHFCTS